MDVLWLLCSWYSVAFYCVYYERRFSLAALVRVQSHDRTIDGTVELEMLLPWRSLDGVHFGNLRSS